MSFIPLPPCELNWVIPELKTFTFGARRPCGPRRLATSPRRLCCCCWTSRHCVHIDAAGRPAARRSCGLRLLDPTGSSFPETSCHGSFAMELLSLDLQTVA